MRPFLASLSCFSLAASFACSSESNREGVGRMLSPPEATAGAAGATPGSAGAGGQGTGAGSGGDSSAGSSSEGPDVMGPLMMGGAGDTGSSAGGMIEDGGGAPVARASCPAGPFAADPLPAGAEPESVCTGMTFSEGPVWFADMGTLFFSDFSIGGAATNFNGRILSYTPGGQCEEFIPNAGTNGLAIAPDGNLLGCRHVDQTLTVFDLTTRQPTVLIADNDGASFNSPNDVAVRSDGNLYFTDPTYLLANRPSELPARAYRRDPSGVLSVIDSGANANGISLSPDETRLYISHFGGGRNDVIVLDVDASGAATNPQPFIDVGSDGMAVDCAGNLYITQNGVRVYDPEGDLLGTLDVDGAANVAFGGPERRTLYITAEDQLFAVELAIPGLPY